MGIQVIKSGSVSAYLKLAGDVALTSSLVSVVDQTNIVSGLQLATASIGLTMPTFLALPNWTNTLGIKTGFNSQQTVAVASLGTGVFKMINSSYTINNTAAQTGTITGFLQNATETALNGMTHNLMDLQIGGVSQMIVKNSGFVGIGTSTPSTFFEVLRTSNGEAMIRLGSTGNNQTGYQIFNNGALKWQMYNANSSNDLRFYDGDIRVVFKSGGDVGIGTVLGAVSARLHIKGSGTTSATTSLLVQNSGGSAAFQVKDNQQVQINFGDTLSSAATPNLIFSSSQTGIYSPNPNQLGIVCYGNETARFIYGSSLHNGALNIGKFANPGNSAFFGWCSDGSLEITGNAQSVFVNPTNNKSLIVGSSTENTTAILQADSTTKGFLMPRQTTAQINAIATPANGLQVYNTTLNQPCFYDGTIWNKVNHSPM